MFRFVSHDNEKRIILKELEEGNRKRRGSSVHAPPSRHKHLNHVPNAVSRVLRTRHLLLSPTLRLKGTRALWLMGIELSVYGVKSHKTMENADFEAKLKCRTKELPRQL